jgi:hypothetical protein
VRFQVIDMLEAQRKKRPAMKKVGTVTANASRKLSVQKLTWAIVPVGTARRLKWAMWFWSSA